MDFTPIDFAHEDQVWVHECMERLKSAFELAALGSEPAPNRLFRWPPPENEVAAILLADALLALELPAYGNPAQDATQAITEVAVGSLGSWLFDLVRSTYQFTDRAESHLIQAIAAQRAAQLYTRFRNLGLRRCEGKLLQVLLSTSSPSAIAVGVDLLVEQPPREWSEGSLAISALVQSRHWKIHDVFPRILDATQPAVLSPALDLANLVARDRGIVPHPAADQFDRMLTLLGGVTQQLAVLEENPSRYSDSVTGIQRMLFDSVSLAVSLCHFFALCGDARAIAKLTQTLDLSHRRIKAEAAFALAKLGEERAIDLLLELVEDDSNRPRVLAYAEELGMEDRMDPQWHSSLSAAKSQLALWLSQPTEFSLAPQRIELMEQRTLPWPGMDQPQDCFLLRFEYSLGKASFRGIGFAGPYASAFPFEVGELSTDELFCMFLAQDIADPSEACDVWGSHTPDHHQPSNAWLGELADRGYTEVVARRSLAFLGHSAIVVDAVDPTGQQVCVLVDSQECMVGDRSPEAVELLRLRWKGRCAQDTLNL